MRQKESCVLVRYKWGWAPDFVRMRGGRWEKSLRLRRAEPKYCRPLPTEFIIKRFHSSYKMKQNHKELTMEWAVLPSRRTGFDPGSVYVGFVVDKVALGQVLSRVLRFSLSISFHRCSITWKNKKKLIIFLSSSSQSCTISFRLRCVRSFCCGALHQKKTSVINSASHTA
jgi:hypothetical protein